MADWPLPDTTTKADGEPRRVGVEIELGDIPVETLARITADTLGGHLEAVSSAEFLVDAPGLGEFRVEIDFELLKNLARRQRASGNDAGATLESLLVEVLGSASTLMVPCEIVSPPIAMTALAEPMDRLVDAVRAGGGKGTRQSVLYAFGVHLNVEPPDLEAQTIGAYLKAFACLNDWILWKGDVDLARRITPYIDRFPRDYERRIADPDYWPDLDTLIGDYLAHNATRNRGFDMLPMFAHFDESRIRDEVDDPLIKPRPAFHYRLANSCVDEPGWSVATPWRCWLAVESLANDRDRLDECCRAFIADRNRVLSAVDNRWREQVEQWIDA